jgi:hypothetical protein
VKIDEELEEKRGRVAFSCKKREEKWFSQFNSVKFSGM